MRLALGAGLLVLGACGAFGGPAEAPAFEVASVKAIAAAGGEGRGHEMVTPSPSGVTMRNIALKSVVGWAYHLQSIQIVGPAWLDNDRYDIVAKASGEVPKDTLRQMMQTLLAQRFKLEFHRDTKEMPAYVISIAKTGLKIKNSETTGEMDVKPNGKMGAAFSRVSLAQLTEMVSSQLQGVVVDQTGLKGTYDFTLDMSTLISSDFHPTSMEDVITLIAQAASEQLGIKIEQKKVPAERLLVDHMERAPVEN